VRLPIELKRRSMTEPEKVVTTKGVLSNTKNQTNDGVSKRIITKRDLGIENRSGKM